MGEILGDRSKSATEPSGGAATIKTFEYGFDTAGLKAGRNTVTFVNGGKEWHQVIMSKLMPGKTLADFQKAAAADGPPTAGLTYVFACFMPDKNGKPHVMSGMVKEVKIAA